jgi:SAM-dependent methyltransferase
MVVTPLPVRTSRQQVSPAHMCTRNFDLCFIRNLRSKQITPPELGVVTPSQLSTSGWHNGCMEGENDIDSTNHARREMHLRSSYNEVAEDYAAHFIHELDDKPLDRALLSAFTEEVAPDSTIADVGCGPGHVTAWLCNHGARALGIDLSPGMIGVARDTFPNLEFHVGDMRSLTFGNEEWGGVVALYSVIHLETHELTMAFSEMYRCLRPEGLLLVGFHGGSEVRHRDEWWGHSVSLDFRLLEATAVEGSLRAAGFWVRARLERENYPGEVATRRVYIVARRPNS